MLWKLVQWNGAVRKLLWLLVLIGLVAALPLAADRYRTEASSKKVEFAFDYRDLLEISDYRPDPQGFIDTELDNMKKSGIHSLVVYESTLDELQLSRRVELYSSHEAGALVSTPIPQNENYTYVVFSDEKSRSVIQPMVEKTFADLGIETQPWSFKNVPGLIVKLPLDEASMKPLPPDPVTMQKLKDQGFKLEARLGNRRSFDEAYMDNLLGTLEKFGVTTIIVDGDSVPGYGSGPTKDGKSVSLTQMAELLNKHHIALAAIELLKAQQKGFTTVSHDIGYNVIRLHSFTENDADKLAQSLTPQELESRIQATADRFVLAVKDRNIRIVFLNARASRNADKGTYVDPIDPLLKSLNGPDGALKRIQDDGYTLGPAHSFNHVHPGWESLLKPLVILGSAAAIALTVSYFFPTLALPIFVVLLAGSGLLYLVSPNGLQKLLALGASVSMPTIALILAVRSLKRKAARSGPKFGPGGRVVEALRLFVVTTVISLIGGALVVGLLNAPIYNLLLDQFTGVKILAYLPVLLIAVYLLFFSDDMTFSQKILKAKKLLQANISVLWILTAGVALGAGYYYLSRTGNEGQASSIELMFRSFLENTLKVRPRTKEFLFGHPLFLLGIYWCLKNRLSALWLLVIAAVGQADAVGTFTHLHTPLNISAIRDTYGVVFGLLIGLAAIVVTEAFARGWKTWVKLPANNES